MFHHSKKVQYKADDGVAISALLYVPQWMKKTDQILLLCGSWRPEWQEKNLFNKYMQLFNNAGYIVIAPNFRAVQVTEKHSRE